MRSVTKDNITEVFTSYLGENTDPRVRERQLTSRYLGTVR